MKKSYSNRFIFCILSLILYAFGSVLGVKAGPAGTNAWNTLAIGFLELTGFSFGTTTFLISLVILIIDFFGKGKLGFGTVFNSILIPVFSDLILILISFIPDASNHFVGAIYSLLGQIIISFAMILYMKPALGCGPRDTLLIIIGKKTPKFPIGVVKFLIELAVMIIGVILGAPFGLGTVLVMILQASLFQLACKITNFEPRSIEHEDLVDTIRAMRNKNNL